MQLPNLPQNDAKRATRKKVIRSSKKLYRYNYDLLPPLAVCDGLPPGEGLDFTFLRNYFGTLRDIALNHVSILRSYVQWGVPKFSKESVTNLFAGNDLKKIDSFLRNSLPELMNGKALRATSFEDYKALYRKFEMPLVVDSYHDDAEFAFQRLGGFNPTVISRLEEMPDNFPVTDQMVQRVTGTYNSVEELIGEGNGFLCDYAAFQNVRCGKVLGLQKYLAAPLALFFWDRHHRAGPHLRPLAIQLGQIPGKQFPVITPDEGWKWTTAKAFVQMADGNHHEAIAHLGACHLSIEPLIVAAKRNLFKDHPVRILVDAHSQYTIGINDQARTILLAQEGIVETLLAGEIDHNLELIGKAQASWRFDQSCPNRSFRNRGVDDPEILPDFPYRDDTLLLWEAIQDFVGKYLRLYYSSDQDLAEDEELQSWFREMVSVQGGRVRGLTVDDAGGVSSFDYLVTLLSQFIHIAGPQHSSVNFAQYSHMSFALNCPLSLYGPPPDESSVEDERSFLERMPPIHVSLYQTEVAYFLSNRRLDRLGHYEANVFKDPRVRSLIKKFQWRLKQIEEEINRRNREERLRPYSLQLPSSITNSVSI